MKKTLRLLTWDPSATRMGSTASILTVAAIFALLTYLNFFSSISKLPYKVFERAPLTTFFTILLWVPVCVLPYIFMYKRYLAEARELIVPVEYRLRTAMSLFIATYLTVSSTYLTGAMGTNKAFQYYWIHWSDENLLLAVLPIAGWTFFAHLICKTWIDRPQTDAVKTFGGLFATSGIFIWGLFIVLDHQSGVRKDFTDYYPEAEFNLDALNFVWYTVTSIGVVTGYLLTIRLHPWTRVVFLAPSISTLPPDAMGTSAGDTVKSD